MSCLWGLCLEQGGCKRERRSEQWPWQSKAFICWLGPGCLGSGVRWVGGFRVIEWFGLEGTLKTIWFQPSAVSRDISTRRAHLGAVP